MRKHARSTRGQSVDFVLWAFSPYIEGMQTEIRLIRHEPVPKSGSFEVRFSDGRPSEYFY
jgi:hypothetical protein